MKRKYSVLVLVVFFMVLYVIPVNLGVSEQTIIPTENSVLSEDYIMRSEHGSSIYLGGGKYSYSTSLGELNTNYYGDWVPYVYDDFTHSVVFAGHRLALYDWYATFENVTSGILVDDMRWVVQYWRDQGAGDWRELDLWEHSFLPVQESSEHLTFGQRFTDGFSRLDVCYTVSNYDQFKVTLNFTSDTVREHRFIWKFTGVDGDLIENNKSIQFDDVNIGWGDATLNATYDWTVADRKVDIIFDSFIGSDYVLDPTVSSVLGADIDDDWWRSTNGVWSQFTVSVEVYVSNQGAAANDFGRQRFALAIPQGKVIDSANLTCYEYRDEMADKTSSIRRINETNVGSLEGDDSFSVINNDTYMEWGWDGVEPEWRTFSVTQLVQNQIDLPDWESGFYMGFVHNFNDSYISAKWFRFEDYSESGSHNVPYLNVTYSTAAAPTTTTPIITAEEINYFEELFLSTEIWGLFGPLALITLGYLATKKHPVLGIIWYIVECVIAAQYLDLVGTTPYYWWHVIILLLGGLTTWLGPMLER